VARSRSPRGEGDRLRTELLDATEQLLNETGDEREVTVRAIVERVGVTPPSLYRHYPDKQSLIREAVARRFGSLGAAIGAGRAPAEQAGDLAGALRGGCLAYLRWAQQEPGGYAMLFSARRDTVLPGGPSRTAAFVSLQSGIEACQQAGLARDGDAFQQALLVWAALHGLATLTVNLAQIDWPKTEALVDGLLEGLVGLAPSSALP